MVGLLLLILPLEYDNYKAITFLYPILWVIIPLYVYGILRRRNNAIINAFVFAGALFYFVFTLTFGLAYVSGFCAWGYETTLYINKQNSSVSIVERGYSCYGTDVDFYYFKVYKLTNHIKWLKECSGKEIDTLNWKKPD